MPVQEDGSFERIWKFVDHRESGDKVMRSDMDIALDDLVLGISGAVTAANGAKTTADQAVELAESAEEAAESALAYTNDYAHEIKISAFERQESALHRIVDHALAFTGRLNANDLGPTYPGVFSTKIAWSRPVETPAYVTKRQIVIDRLTQLFGVRWTPLVDVDGQIVPEDDSPTFPVGVEASLPYSSTRRVGRPVGPGVPIETFVNATRNPDSIFYEDFTEVDFHAAEKDGEGNVTNWRGMGRLYYGAVCSNVLAFAFDWFSPPVTRLIARNFRDYGFVYKFGRGNFSADDLRIGDVVVSYDGGHIEFVSDKDGEAETITLLDQGYEGPKETVLSFSDANGYFSERQYVALVYDYNQIEHEYSSDPYAPLPDEDLDPPDYPDLVMLNRGSPANYLPGEDVRYRLSDDSMDELIITTPSGEDTINTSGDEVITRDYSEVGLYTAQAQLSSSPVGQPVQFRIAHVEATISASTVSVDEDVTVTFTGHGCTPVALIVHDAEYLSITNGILKEITESHFTTPGSNSGEITIAASVSPRDWHVVVRAVTPFGEVLTAPLDTLTLTVE